MSLNQSNSLKYSVSLSSMMKLLNEMEIPSSYSSIAVSIMLVAVVTLIWRLGNRLWFRPKKLEKYLKRQGFLGNPYRFYYGDWKENVEAMKAAGSKPFDDFSHDVASRIAPFLAHTIRRYGKNSFTWTGPVPSVNIMNPEHIKDVLMKVYEFEKVKINPYTTLLVPGLAAHEQDQWAKHRKIINPAFHHENLKLMLPQMYECCNMMIESWNQLMTEKESCEIDVCPYLQNLSSDVISRCAFGSNYEEGKLIFDLIRELTQLLMQMAQFIYIPGWRFFPSKTNRRMKQLDREMTASLKNIIKKREKASEAGRDDLLGMLMESNLKEIEEKGRDKNMGLSMKDVMDECRLFYVAGQDTTSALLVWTMILLSKYPIWQTRARDEVLQVFGKAKPDFEGLNRLKVVSMILNEVLRLYPPVSTINRTSGKEIRMGNLELPSGIELVIPVVLIHQDREIWGDDALEFNPERFSGGISKAAKHLGAYLPFGMGPRICVAQNFALVEAKMALALILQNFSFEISPSYSHAPCIFASVRPEFGAPLILHKL